MKQTYRGGCHCGQVRYELDAELGEVMSCNCSRCQKLGALLTFVAPADFRLVAGDGATTDYQFNTRIIHHRFCPTCGIESFANGKGRDGADVVAINVRCLDDVDLSSLKVRTVDGRSR